MNCQAFEQDIALYVEGDLRESGWLRVESHIERCANCGGLVDELRQSQAVFKSLRLSSANSAALAEVRQRVMEEVGGLEPAPAWVLMMHRLIFAGMRRRTAIAGFALVALVSGTVWYAETRVVSEQEGDAPVAVARNEAPSPLMPAVTHPSTKVLRSVKQVSPAAVSEALLVEAAEVQSIADPTPPDSQVSQIPMKFLTDDPDIIIYWLPTDKGD